MKIRDKIVLLTTACVICGLISVGCSTNSYKEEYENTLLELETTNETLEATQEELQENLAELRITEGELATAEEALTTTRVELDGKSKAIDGLEDDLKMTKDQLEETAQQLDTAKTQLSYTQSQLDSAKTQLDSTNQLQSSNQKEVETLNQRIQELQTELETMKSTVSGMGISIQSSMQCTDTQLTDNENAKNPVYAQLASFLLGDRTEYHDYIEDVYDCSQFAQTLHDNAEEAGIRCAVVHLRFKGTSVGHALNAFLTTDHGIVFIDDTPAEDGILPDKMLVVKVGYAINALLLSPDWSSLQTTGYGFKDPVESITFYW